MRIKADSTENRFLKARPPKGNELAGTEPTPRRLEARIRKKSVGIVNSAK
jgi:hypothetical protein